MTSIEYLEQVRALDAQLGVIRREASDMRDRAQSLRGISYDGDRVQVSPGMGAAYEELIDTLTDKETELAKMAGDIEAKRLEIIKSLEALPAEMYVVLYLYYVKLMDREAVAQEMHYSAGHISRLKKAALREWDKIYAGYQR